MDLTLNEIAEIIDKDKGTGYFAKQFDKSLRPIWKKFESIGNEVESSVSLSDFIFLSDSRKEKISNRYFSVINSLLDKIEKTKVEDIIGGETGNGSPTPDSKGEKRNKKPPPLPPNTPKMLTDIGGEAPPLPPVLTEAKKLVDKNKEKVEEEFKLEGSETKIQRVHLHSIEEGLLEKLNIGGNTATVGIVEGSSSSSSSSSSLDGKKGGWISTLGKILAGGALGLVVLAAGAMALWEGFKSDGPSKGFLKVIGLKLAKMGIGMVKNMFKIIKTIFAPKWLTAFFKPKVLAPATAKAGKAIGGKGIFKGLMGLMGKAGKGAKFIFKKIPILGSLISFAFAWSRFQKGDIVGGILDIVSGILTLDPSGIGSMIAIIPDLINTFRDVTMSPAEKRQQGSGFFDSIAEWFTNLKFIKALTNTFKGFALIFGGSSSDDVDKGIDLLLKDNSLLMVIFPALGAVIEIVQWIRAGGISEMADSIGEGLNSFGTWLSEIFGGVWTTIKEVFGRIWNVIVTKLTHIGESNHVQMAISSFVVGFLTLITNVTWLLDYLKGKIAVAWNKVADSVNGVFGDVVGKMEVASSAHTSAKGALKRAQDQLDANMKKDLEQKERHKKEDEQRIAEKKEKKAEQREADTRAIIVETAKAQVEATNGVTQAVKGTSKVGDGQKVYNFITGAGASHSESLRDRMFKALYGA